jgi:L-ascorbate metabolism protein UlaG (beta-lactamase superfamily)
MELTFLGKGSAFNTKLGNNSAYIKFDTSLFLLDCGGTVFSKLMEQDESGNFILKDVTSVHVAITHLHPDHVGSLGDLIYFCYYALDILPIIIYPNAVDLEYLLYKMGIRKLLYNIDDLREGQTHGYKNNNLNFYLEPVEVEHYRGQLSYAYLIQTNDKTIYYSGDANEVPQDIYQMLLSGRINEFYHEISGRAFNPEEYWPHFQYYKALSMFDSSIRNKIYFMHMDEEFNSEQAILDGFGVV